MSRNSRRSHRWGINQPGVWRLIDDISGFEIKSTEAVMNYKGQLTSKSNYDTIPFTELKIKYREEKPVPYTRLEPPDLDAFTITPTTSTVVHFEDNRLAVPGTPITPYSPATNPNMTFHNWFGKDMTFGEWPNSSNTIVPLSNTGIYQGWGENTDYYVTTGTLGVKGLL